MSNPNIPNGAAPSKQEKIARAKAKARGEAYVPNQEQPANPAAPAATPEPKAPREIEDFLAITEEAPEFDGAIKSLVMVSSLLKNSFKPNGLEVSEMGFDKDHMKKLMRAVFILVKRRNVKNGEIASYFKQARQSSPAVIYKSLLGLNKQSTPGEIRQKLTRLATEMEQFPDLAAYDQDVTAIKALGNCNDVEKRELKLQIAKSLGIALKDAPERPDDKALEPLSDEDCELTDREKLREMINSQRDVINGQRDVMNQLFDSGPVMSAKELERLSDKELKRRVIKHHGFGETVPKFDLTRVDEIIKAAEDGKAALANVSEFYSENLHTPAFRPLSLLRKAFAASKEDYEKDFQYQYFGGADQTHIIPALNRAFPNGPSSNMGLGRSISKADGNIPAVLKTLVDDFDIKSEAAMKTALADIFAAIDDLYPDLREGNDPVRLEREQEMTEFYDELYVEDKSLFYPLHYLYLALLDRNDDEHPDEYNTKFKDQLFEKADLATVMERLNGELAEDDIVQKLQAFAKIDAAKTKECKAGLIKGIARIYGHKELNDDFMKNVEKVSKAIADLYEDTTEDLEDDSEDSDDTTTSTT